MLYVISDGKLSVTVSDRGAELQSVVLSGHEFLYDGKGLWNRRAPILFPIVGRLQNDTYLYKGKEYRMGGHGFARDIDFVLTEKTENTVSLTLTENEETLGIYPFRFVFTVTYKVSEGKLDISYGVKNPAGEPLLYSVGAHEAYFCPMAEGKTFEDCSLVFEKEENAPAYEVAPPLLSGKTYKIFESGNVLPLRYRYFDVDAIVLKEHKSRRITLTDGKYGVEVSFPDFPLLGIWTKPGANFVCIEPWCGVCDTVGVSGEFTEKEGIVTLPPHGEKTVVHTIRPIINM